LPWTTSLPFAAIWIDRDFGHGYKYSVIIENAVLVETPTAEGKTPVAE